jgi:hypothetical protein
VVLPDGLMLTHGGFPHTDLIDSLRCAADLGRPECLQDFVWLRASESARRKLPNRNNRGCEFGHEDFARFCQWTQYRLRPGVWRMLRGHDHVPERHLYYPRYRDYPVVTLNTMCRRLPDEWLDSPYPLACIARHVPGQLPEIHRLPIDPEEVESVHFPRSS